MLLLSETSDTYRKTFDLFTTNEPDRITSETFIYVLSFTKFSFLYVNMREIWQYWVEFMQKLLKYIFISHNKINTTTTYFVH